MRIAHDFLSVSAAMASVAACSLLFLTIVQCTRVSHTRRLQLKTIPMILISITLGPLGNVFLGKGMKTVGPVVSGRVHDIIPIVSRVLASGYIWLGISCLLGFFIAHMLLLTWADYSYVQPATSLSYLSISILSYLLLGERISPLRWIGVTVICLGVLLVGRTPPSTTGEPPRA
jgi:drug/metabolite transporter (DMT)-like permease